MIERMVNEMGKRWAEIARRLGNRSDNAVKNWWNGSMNRKKRCLNLHQPNHPSRTSNGRVEPPYNQISNSFPHLVSWTKSSQARPELIPSNTCSSSAEGNASPAVKPVECPSKATPFFTLPALNRPMDAPLPSPAFSEASHSPSLDPPPLVADDNSVTSASPRTLSSPHLPPLPLEIRQGCAGDMRRQSVLLAHATLDDAYFSSDVTLRGFSGTLGLDSLAELASKHRWSSDLPTLSWHGRSSTSHDNHPPSTSSGESKPCRDERMGLAILLN